MSEEGKPADECRSEVVRVSARYLSLGMTFAASVALFGWVGFVVGTRVGESSLLTIFGVLLGGAAGFSNLYVQVVVKPREESDEA
jgi:hypothetical protein